MREYLGAMACILLVGLSACDAPHKAKEGPAKPETTSAASASADTDQPKWMAQSGLPSANLKEEAATLALFPEAHRDGGRLTLSLHGAPIAEFRDNDAGYAWQFLGRFTHAETGAEARTYFMIRSYDIGTDLLPYTLIIDDTGKPVEWVYDKVKVYEGGLIASGSKTADGDFAIDDWTTSPHTTTVFEHIPCEPQKWLSAKAVAVMCLNSMTDKVEPDVLKKLPNGSWTFGPPGEPVKPGVAKSFTAEDTPSLAQMGYQRLSKP